MSEKFQWYRGKKFVRDDSSGYYLNSSMHVRLHRYVWECERGGIPDGCHIHHKDGDKSNNAIENLELMDAREHMSFHSSRADKDILRERMDYARMFASEWHGSKDGKEWHKKHYEQMKDKLYVERKFSCECCGKEFVSTASHSRFCSNKCKSKQRRLDGTDNETRKCEICGSEFKSSKYSNTKTCSRECGRTLSTNKKHKKDGWQA